MAFDPIQCDLIRDGVESLKHVSNLEIGILKSKNRDCFVWGADEHVQLNSEMYADFQFNPSVPLLL